VKARKNYDVEKYAAFDFDIKQTTKDMNNLKKQLSKFGKTDQQIEKQLVIIRQSNRPWYKKIWEKK
jgi:septal ring factor EnvC (AmiA/AmiB activator)